MTDPKYKRTKIVATPKNTQVGTLVTSRWSGSGAIHTVVDMGATHERYNVATDTRISIKSVTSGRGRIEWMSSLTIVEEASA